MRCCIISETISLRNRVFTTPIGALPGSEAGYTRFAREFLGDVCDFVIDDFLRNLDIQIFLRFADVDQFCFHVGSLILLKCERGDSNPHGVSH